MLPLFNHGTGLLRLLAVVFFCVMTMPIWADSFEVPQESPPTMLLDRDDVFVRNPVQKAEIEERLLAFRDKHQYPIYLIVLNNSIGFDIGERLQQVRESWLGKQEGIILCVDVSTYKFYMNEPVPQLDEATGEITLARLLPEMPLLIRPTCARLAITGKEQKLHGIKLIEHYTYGFLQVADTELSKATPRSIAPTVLWGSIIALVLGGVLIYYVIERSRRRHELEFQKHTNYEVYRFPRVYMPVRLGAVNGGMISKHEYDNDSSRPVNLQEKVRTKKVRWGKE